MSTVRHSLRFQIGASLLALLLFAGTSQGAENDSKASIESIRQEVQNLQQELKDFTEERRQELTADIEATLTDIDARIEALEARVNEDWQQMDRVARAHARSSLGALRRERGRVADWYQRMQDSPEYTWESMKDGFNEAFNNMAEAWKTAEKDVQKAIDGEK